MSKPVPFEKSIAELETIVNLLEKGDLALEESLKQFEKGILLARKCEEVLREAEQKVELLAATALPGAGEPDA